MIKTKTNAELFKDTKHKYEELRKIAAKFSEEKFKDYSIGIREIRHSDAVAADSWKSGWADSQKVPSWNWVDMYTDYHSNAGTKRFDMALVVNGTLVALCYGNPTSTKMTLKIHALARGPKNNPLEGKILRIILFTATAYARLLGSKEIWICQPMNEAIVGKYEKLGFNAHKNNIRITTHLSQGIRYD